MVTTVSSEMRVRDTKFWDWLGRSVVSAERLGWTLLLDTLFGGFGVLLITFAAVTSSMGTFIAGMLVTGLTGARIATKFRQITYPEASSAGTLITVRAVVSMVCAVGLAVTSLTVFSVGAAVFWTAMAVCWFAAGAVSAAFILLNDPFLAERARKAELLAELRDKLVTSER